MLRPAPSGATEHRALYGKSGAVSGFVAGEEESVGNVGTGGNVVY